MPMARFHHLACNKDGCDAIISMVRKLITCSHWSKNLAYPFFSNLNKLLQAYFNLDELEIMDDFRT
eukprot:CAMPEP_0194093178 /NCGR_PEP_ID=MMETSP0149-20130528/49501_1 /TAXON_ID=122233 /ORGANISM="Chaetoceros debilis, Strain MM31A-1" /LENGTH=65 /DNA_ID=CAMNT_0038778399 /DNA_START=35 /DNA_END=232 /DNA_ORIENTATION=+